MNEPSPNRWQGDPADAWLPYEPTAADPWDLKKIFRLHRRAGFGATWAEAQRDLADGYKPSIERVLNGAPTGPDGRPAAAIDVFAKAMSESYRSGSGQLDGIRTAWFYRMVFGPFPLGERMRLAWHTHYATSESRVNNKPSLAVQHDTQRKLCRSPISQMHLAMLRDEAMLSWLDGAENIRSSPNENLAREFLELFALGVGNYSEKDVQEAARALTGWQEIFERTQQLKYVAVLHDPGEKTILGHTGTFGDEDLVRIVCASRPPRGESPGGCGARSSPTSTSPRRKSSKAWPPPCAAATTSTWPAGSKSCCAAGCSTATATPAAGCSRRSSGW